MKLLLFLQDLFESGQVLIPAKFYDVDEAEKAAAISYLANFHAREKLEMPLEAPDFHPEAAFWAAGYIFKACQFLMMRHLEAEAIPVHLLPCSFTATPEVAYSVDLCLRFLPEIYHWSKALSDEDPLLLHFRETSKAWPFSCIGIPGSGDGKVPRHPSLNLAYADRILEAKNLQLALMPDQKPLIQAALGPLAEQFWPSFYSLKEHNQ